MSRAYLSRLLLLLGIVAPAAVAQIHPYFGVEAGVPLTDTLTSSSYIIFAGSITSANQYNSETKRLLIGPTFRVDLAHGLGLEFDTLYQRIDYDFNSLNSGPGYFTQTFQQTTANRWQFPLLIQYSFAFRKTKFFVEAGPSISHLGGTKDHVTQLSSTPPSPASSSFAGQTETWAGFTTGGGMDIHWARLHLRPEFRYSRWFSPTSGNLVGAALAIYPVQGFIGVPISPQSFYVNPNEASFLLGLTF